MSGSSRATWVAKLCTNPRYSASAASLPWLAAKAVWRASFMPTLSTVPGPPHAGFSGLPRTETRRSGPKIAANFSVSGSCPAAMARTVSAGKATVWGTGRSSRISRCKHFARQPCRATLICADGVSSVNSAKSACFCIAAYPVSAGSIGRLRFAASATFRWLTLTWRHSCRRAPRGGVRMPPAGVFPPKRSHGQPSMRVRSATARQIWRIRLSRLSRLRRTTGLSELT